MARVMVPLPIDSGPIGRRAVQLHKKLFNRLLIEKEMGLSGKARQGDSQAVA